MTEQIIYKLTILFHAGSHFSFKPIILNDSTVRFLLIMVC